MDVRLAISIFIFFSAIPAFSSEDNESFMEGLFLPSTDQITQPEGAHPDETKVDRKPAVLGLATQEPVTYSAKSEDPEDQPIDPSLKK